MVGAPGGTVGEEAAARVLSSRPLSPRMAARRSPVTTVEQMGRISHQTGRYGFRISHLGFKMSHQIPVARPARSPAGVGRRTEWQGYRAAPRGGRGGTCTRGAAVGPAASRAA